MLERFKVPESDRVYVPVDEMRQATEKIFSGMGLANDDAVLSADVLLVNDLRGVETHGVSNMLRSYVGRYRDSGLNPRPELRTERESDTPAVLDGGGGIGLHLARLARKMGL